MTFWFQRPVSVSGGGASPAYTPFYTASLAAGSAGQSPVTVGEVDSGFHSPVYSSAAGNPWGAGIAVQYDWVENGSYFGGILNSPAIAVSAGDTLWFRLYHYFPAAWCHSGGDNNTGDYWGNCKWLRLQFGTGGTRLTYQLGNMTLGTCQTGGIGVGLTTREYNGAANLAIDPTVNVSRDTWAALQFAVHFQSDTTGWIRYWIGETYLGEVSGVSTLSTDSGQRTLEELILGDYINGAGYANQSFYVSECIATFDQPNTVDSGDRPYISPSTRVSDFA